MDSLTQIILGAACGEAVLGKKIGNKALLLGAIGGTIPDLDVILGNFIYKNQIDAMLFHRGFMHSIFFSIGFALIFGWLSFRLHNYKTSTVTITLKRWFLFWFLALFTHPVLDCFTPYGTQLFAPFSNYRVAFNTIAVADPLYTLPFLVCLCVVMFYRKTSFKRQLWLNIGLGISSLYLLFTVFNKFYIDCIFEKSLKQQHIAYSRYTVQPTILNNILWYGIAETETGYYNAEYSFLDREVVFKDFVYLPKVRALKKDNFNDLKQLSWFSNHYYNLYPKANGYYVYNDLRYPMLDKSKPNTSVFRLKLYKEGNRLNMQPFEPQTDNLKNLFQNLWLRIKGI